MACAPFQCDVWRVPHFRCDQAVPVEQLETLFFGKPTPLKKQPHLHSVWSTASGGSSNEGSQVPTAEEEDEPEATASLLQHIDQQLGGDPVVRLFLHMFLAFYGGLFGCGRYRVDCAVITRPGPWRAQQPQDTSACRSQLPVQHPTHHHVRHALAASCTIEPV